MPAPSPVIEPLSSLPSEADLRALASLLSAAVEAGEAVSFLAPLPIAEAEAWWRRSLGAAGPRSSCLAARESGGIVGVVQLQSSWAPNQPHRAEIQKLLVDRRVRRRGLGTRLMRAAEETARRQGFRLLTLDAKRGAAAEQLYRRLGWTHAGTIPGFAFDPDGTTPHDAVIFYKELSGLPEAPSR